MQLEGRGGGGRGWTHFFVKELLRQKLNLMAFPWPFSFVFPSIRLIAELSIVESSVDERKVKLFSLEGQVPKGPHCLASGEALETRGQGLGLRWPEAELSPLPLSFL